MPVHDWTRVSAGTFHDFHCAWMGHLRGALNRGVLPNGYYAQLEQRALHTIPDVLTLQETEEHATGPSGGADDEGGIAVAAEPPRVKLIQTVDESDSVVYSTRQRTLVIRHASEDRVAALIEIVSPGNKKSRDQLDEFLDKAVAALRQDVHVLIIDLHPPGRHDPRGVHSELWRRVTGNEADPPDDLPVRLAGYCADDEPTAYVESCDVGDALPAMPLFLTRERYVNVPLEETYDATWEETPERWRRVIDAGSP